MLVAFGQKVRFGVRWCRTVLDLLRSTNAGESWTAPSYAPFPFRSSSNGCEGSMISLPGRPGRLAFSQPYSKAGRFNMVSLSACLTLKSTMPIKETFSVSVAQKSLCLRLSQTLCVSPRVFMVGRSQTVHLSDTAGISWGDAVNVDPGPSGYSALAAINQSVVALAWESSGSIRFIPELRIEATDDEAATTTATRNY